MMLCRLCKPSHNVCFDKCCLFDRSQAKMFAVMQDAQRQREIDQAAGTKLRI